MDPADVEPSWLVHAESTVDAAGDDGLAGPGLVDANAARLNPSTRTGPTRVVIGVGSTGRPPYRSALRLADALGVPVVRFPGDHLGFSHHPTEFARRLRSVLDDAGGS